MNNLDYFNLIVAQVFSSCYTAFPMGVDFSLNNIGFDAPAEIKPQLFACTIRWLERYGWISIELKSPAPMFLQVQLTEKALCALNWLPETLQENDSPLGQRIREALTAKAPASAVGSLVGEVVKAFIRPGV